ncbi:uridine kinase family-domain-containing protein [Rhodotorula diobovata]|uniref:Uridine kinase n=1 Tax=Rhodotorula diobovata TaxID=5288 RepID=A0A5C5FPB2_9BASI|nr:uridine kinase family-domain-containing protein [Rhodotorula diobovata]
MPSPHHQPEGLLKNTILSAAARNPWYGPDGKPAPAYIIGIGGGSASGKTRVAQEVLKQLGVPWVLVISQDNFYKPLTPEESAQARANNHDFDSPDSFDYPALRDCVRDLKECRAAQIPNYSFVHHQRTDETTYLYGANVIIVEGIFVLYDKGLRDLLDLKVYVQCDSDLMLARRLRRDLVERGRDADGVLKQYLRFVKPALDNFIQPTNRFADIIVPGERNERSVELIVSHLKAELGKRRRELRGDLYKETVPTGAGSVPQTPAHERSESEGGLDRIKEACGAHRGAQLPDTVHLLKETPQIRGIHTLLRASDTDPDDFIFLADRLSTLVIEHALSLLPYREKAIETRTGIAHVGMELDVPAGHLCGVSILRSGASLEKGLRRVVEDVPVGSVLVQSDASRGEPLLYQVALPQCLTASRDSAAQSYVLLLDSQIGTGAAALMAVRILLDHGVLEEHIIVSTILVSRVGGVWALKRAFPKVRIVSSMADDGLEERWEKTHGGEKKIFTILPGMGSFGDRYFRSEHSD